MPDEEASPSPKPSDTLSRDGVMTRVDGACAVVGAEQTMTLDDIKGLIDVDVVYNYAREEGVDLVSVVREVANRSLTVQNALDLLADEKGVDRVELGNMTNWFDIYRYAEQQQMDLDAAMRQAYAIFGNKEEETLLESYDVVEAAADQSSLSAAVDDGRRKRSGKLEKAFKTDLKRLQTYRGIPDGRANRSKTKESRQAQKRAAKSNEKRGGLKGYLFGGGK